MDDFYGFTGKQDGISDDITVMVIKKN